MLSIHDVVKDYAAILDRVEPDGSPAPSEGLTLEQNLVDLGWHQKEFQLRRSFAYTVMSRDESVCLGCVYLYPTDDADARVHMWVRKERVGGRAGCRPRAGGASLGRRSLAVCDCVVPGPRVALKRVFARLQPRSATVRA